ncbi:C40 family peptidase [Actinomadura scrupuli]|uniref:C40 family peptidase n=1 Tax=Actinomadura scrupuli TaxID=559629 RepID=UPI003D97B070
MSLAGVMVGAAIAVVPVSSVAAEPKPTRKELTAQEKKLADQLEKMTEQYNGLQVRLKQAQKAAKSAADGARAQQRSLETVRLKVAQMAAESYKSGGLDPAVALAGAKDPQALLDQSATLNYFTSQGSTQVRDLLQVLQASTRAQKAAQDRTAQVKSLSRASQQKLTDIRSALKKVRGKLGQSTASGGPAPNVAPGGASAKAMGAVRAALARLGTPYSWGGGGPNGPTYGVAQGSNIKGFDCSGLTLYAYAQVGISLPHYTGSQYNSGVHVTRAQLRPGDLVFFYSDLHHMGMYIGNGNMVHAPQTGDVVKISPLSGHQWAGAVRVA